MFRPTVARSIAAPVRGAALQRTAARSVRQEIPSFRNASMRGYATQPSAGGEGGIGNRHTIIILSALGLIGAGGYYLLKPVADVASSAKTVIDTASSGASVASSQVEDLVKSFLPPGAFALYSVVASQSGGIGGFLSNLKDKDLQGVIDEVKKAGNEDVTRIAEKVEKKVKEAKGQVSKVDWKGLIQELKTELPKDKQQMIDSLIGQIPDKADFDKYFAKAKEAGGEQLKEAEKAANKIWAQVEKAKKDGKGQANALLAGLKSSAPNDLDDLVKQVKQTAKNAGLPADAIESWLKNKADEKNIDPEHLAQQVQDKVQTAVKFLPSDPKDLVKQVEQISPSLAKLLQQALEQADAIKN